MKIARIITIFIKILTYKKLIRKNQDYRFSIFIQSFKKNFDEPCIQFRLILISQKYFIHIIPSKNKKFENLTLYQMAQKLSEYFKNSTTPSKY